MKKSRRRANVNLHLIQPKFPSSVATSVRNFFDHHGKDLVVAVKVKGTTHFSLFDGRNFFQRRVLEVFSGRFLFGQSLLLLFHSERGLAVSDLY